ncbi:ThiF family adenylyltransferase [Nitratireductor luteus]|uniref:ThiF family adenylyltransferase n=1 Tax=Nitratireductor luteus TaxID=2976980 RepID=UPI00224058A2|nr:ThiF family adenylyltransferase [Nitratireductor luteus]
MGAGETDKPQAGPVPRWEKRFPGRFAYELKALNDAGVGPEIDDEALAVGQLVLTFSWSLDAERTLRLQAVFPDSYPHFRPQVYLLSGLDPVPTRHRSPIEGNLCLLGRDTGQWRTSWSLCKLLQEQLGPALDGGDEEDPQGEPAEYWWNALGRSGSYCLIDSSWDLGDATQGSLLVRYVWASGNDQAPNGESDIPVVRAVVEEIRDADGSVLHRWTSILPVDLKSSDHVVEIPWVRSEDTVFPEPDLGAQIRAMRDALASLAKPQLHSYRPGHQFELFAIAYPSELAFGQTGLGWTFIFTHGHIQAFKVPEKRKGTKKSAHLTVIPALRAGADDLGRRVPAVAALKDKRVVVVGAGAVGAPVAIELARNRCATLDIIEHDIVEPGNTVRWPLGASAWAKNKAFALRDFLESEYPGTQVSAHPSFLGFAGQDGQQRDDDLLDELLPKADLVVDGSASHGVTMLLASRCREAGVPLVSLSATPTLEGGAVVRHAEGGGCPNCLEHAWHDKNIEPPPGRGEGEDDLIQPPGCSERTFVGADFDLQELSLQAVRLVVETLGGEEKVSSEVQTLGFVDEDGKRCPPRWRVDDLPKHPKCTC